MGALQRPHVADADRGLRDVALDGFEHAGRRLRPRLRERDRLLGATGPRAEHLRDRRHRFGRGDVAVHREDGLVRVQVLGVPGDEIVAREALHGRVGHLPRERRVTAVHQLAELAARDRVGIVVLAGDAGLDAAPGHLEARRVEPRLPQDVREHLQHLAEVLLEHAHARRSGIVADARLDGGGAALEIAVEGLGRECDGAARSHLRAGQARDADLVGRLEERPGPEARGHAHERQFVILHHQHHEAVGQHRARRPRQRKGRQGRVLQLVHGRDLGVGGGSRQSAEDERHEGHSCTHAAHRVPPAAGAASFSSRATVRLVTLNTSAATRRMSALVTASVRSMYLKISRQSPVSVW